MVRVNRTKEGDLKRRQGSYGNTEQTQKWMVDGLEGENRAMPRTEGEGMGSL